MVQTIFTDDVLVDGSRDVKQLRVQGHTTQSDSLQTWENSAGIPLAQMSGDGRLSIGDDLGVATADAMVEVHRAETSISKPKRGLHTLGRISDSLVNVAQWLVAELEIRGSSAMSALQTTLRVRATNMNTGVPDSGAEVRAADVEVVNDATAGVAPLPKATGLQVAVTNASGKTITEAVGIRVKMNNAGTITNPYAIYTEGEGVTHLEDYIEVKRPAQVPGTPATDFMRLYPKSDGKLYAKNWNGVEYDLASSGGNSTPPIASICDGRLTLNIVEPMPILDILNANLLYFTPFRGHQIALYNGTDWVLYPFTQLSLNLSSPTLLAANTLYDIFIYDDAGTLRLEAVAWTSPATGAITSIQNNTDRTVTVPSHTLAVGNLVTITGNSVASNNTTWRVHTITATTFTLRTLAGALPGMPGSIGMGGTWQRADQNMSRATALFIQNGVYVKTGALGRRYLGTIRIGNVAGQTEDSVRRRLIYNEYNQVERKLYVQEPISSWTYTTAAWRPANNNSNLRVEVVVGNIGVMTNLNLVVRTASAGPGASAGFGIDTTTTATTVPLDETFTTLTNDGHLSAHLSHHPPIGYHFYQWIENGRGAPGTTYWGVGNTLAWRSGITGSIVS